MKKNKIVNFAEIGQVMANKFINHDLSLSVYQNNQIDFRFTFETISESHISEMFDDFKMISN